ncbi:hypothetical protein AB4K20DRAFT_1989266 [Rhizopus microsporus]|uniref:Uncharacterized protein n=1 Tax=Rhizopus microsporus TaxID=58291 RepID=A0A1X0RLU6_RHIZD|nr:hypothetical protein BCV71DRAFT_258851 [Rhizopus microsporus]
MKPQDKASSSYVHRKLQELPFVKKLNTSKYRSLKENTLTAINYNKTLEITSKLKDIDKKDIDAVQTFIKTVQARIQDKTFIPLKHTDPPGSRYFSLLPLYNIDSKSIQIDVQFFWKLGKQCDNKIKPGQKNNNNLTLWYFNVFDFSKTGYKTLESLNSRSKKFAYLITLELKILCIISKFPILVSPRKVFSMSEIVFLFYLVEKVASTSASNVRWCI